MTLPQTPAVGAILPKFPPLTDLAICDIIPVTVPLIPPCPPTHLVDDAILLTPEAVTNRFIQAMRDFLHAHDTLEAYRVHGTDFTRRRVFTFPRIAIAILYEHSKASQTRLLDLFLDGGFGSFSRLDPAISHVTHQVEKSILIIELSRSVATLIWALYLSLFFGF